MRNNNFMKDSKRRRWMYGAIAFAVAATTMSGASASEMEGRSSGKEGASAEEPNIIPLQYTPNVEVATERTTTSTKIVSTTTSTTETTSTAEITSTMTETTSTEVTTSTEEIEGFSETVIEQVQDVVEDAEPVVYDVQYSDTGGIICEVPNWDACCHSEVKTYMGYQAVTLVASSQYQLLNSSYAYTDEHGLRMYDDGTGARYCVALGSYYTTAIGQKFDLVMEDGHYVPCILGDAKADVHTNWSNQYGSANGDVAEFIIDNTVYYQMYDMSGTVNWVEGLSGKIQSIILY